MSRLSEFFAINLDMAKTRELWVDCAKAWGMFLIFHGHVVEYAFGDSQTGLLYEQFRFIYAFHVPLFFFLAGYVLKKPSTTFVVTLEKKISTLIIPGIVFLLFTIPFHLIEDFYTGNFSIPKYLNFVTGILKGVPQTSWLTWFLFCLFTAQLLFWLVYPLFAKNKLVCLFLLYVVGWSAITYLPSTPVPNVWFLHNAALACFFLYLGHYAKLKQLNPNRLTTSQKWLFVILTAILTYLSLYLNSGLSSYDKSAVIMAVSQVGNPFGFLLSAILGIIFVSLLSDLTSKLDWLGEIGKVTLFLIFIGGLFFHFGNQILIDNFPVYLRESLVISTLAVSIITFWISVIVSYWMKKVVTFPTFKFPFSKIDLTKDNFGEGS